MDQTPLTPSYPPPPAPSTTPQDMMPPKKRMIAPILFGIVGAALIGSGVWWYMGRNKPTFSTTCADSNRQTAVSQAIQPYRGQSDQFIYEVESRAGACPDKQYVSVDLRSSSVSLHYTGVPFTEGEWIGAYWRKHQEVILSQLDVTDTFKLAIPPTSASPKMSDGTYFLTPAYSPDGTEFAVLGEGSIEIRDMRSTEIVKTYSLSKAHVTDYLEDWDGEQRFLLSSFIGNAKRMAIFDAATGEQGTILTISDSDTDALFGELISLVFDDWYFMGEEHILISTLPTCLHDGIYDTSSCPVRRAILFLGRLIDGKLISVTKIDEADELQVIAR